MGASLSSFSVAVGLISIPAAATLFALLLVGGLQLKSRLFYHTSGCTVPRSPNRFFVGSLQAKDQTSVELEERDKRGKVFYFAKLWMTVIIAADADLAQIILAK